MTIATIVNFKSVNKMIGRSRPCLTAILVSVLVVLILNGSNALSTRGGSSSDDSALHSNTKQSSSRSPVLESFFAASDVASSSALTEDIRSRAHDLSDFLVDTRRTLHRHPELMYQEKETSRVIRTILDELNITYSTGWGVNTHNVIPGEGGYGIVADIGTGQEPCVLLRADMDALPIFEETEGIESFKSRHDGIMHACGHDAHTTMLLGAAALLNDMKDSLQGTVRVMFQPAEEGGAGAKRMREEGVLEQDPKPQHAFGMHLWPT